MTNISYRVYSSYNGWKLLGIDTNVNDVITRIKNRIDIEKAQYIVVEHHNDQDMDIPFKSIACEEEFIEFEKEYKEKVKELVR